MHNTECTVSSETKIRAILLTTAAAFIGVFTVWSSPASACSCPALDRGFMAPEGGRLPSNAKGVMWYGKFRDCPNLSEWFTVEVLEADRYRELPVRVDPVDGFPGVYVVGPDGNRLRPGATYERQDICAGFFKSQNMG